MSRLRSTRRPQTPRGKNNDDDDYVIITIRKIHWKTETIIFMVSAKNEVQHQMFLR